MVNGRKGDGSFLVHSPILSGMSFTEQATGAKIASRALAVLTRAQKDAALHATNVTLFSQVEFKTAGTYYVEVLVDDVMKLRYPVPVVHTPPPESKTPPPPEKPGA